jgi:hypothetical protein
MPTPTIPPVLPIWTVGNSGVRQQPTNGEQFTGFYPSFRPPSGWHNWLFGIMCDWIAWLNYVTQASAFSVSNVGHVILTDTTLQGQLDQTDAFLSSLGLQYLTMTKTSATTWTLPQAPLNVSGLLIFLDGLDEEPTTDWTYSVIATVPTITFAVAPAAGQTPQCLTLTADQPGSGGSAITGGYVLPPGNSAGSPLVITGAGGITPQAVQRGMQFVESSGGIVAVTANPQIVAGTKVGQELVLSGTSDVNAITLATGNGLLLTGPITLGNGVSISLFWNGAVWQEQDRSNY